MTDLSYMPKSGIEGFPYHNPHARIIVKTGYANVIERTREKTIVIGKIVDNRFYTPDEYQKLFKKNGIRRTASDYTPAQERQKRGYVRKKPLSECKPSGRKRIHPVPELSEIEGIPDEYRNQTAVFLKYMHGVIYLVHSESYRNEGKQFNKTRILGRIHELRFYTLADYKRLFAPAKHPGGRPRKNRSSESLS